MEHAQHARQVLAATQEDVERWRLLRDMMVPGAFAGLLGAVLMAALALPLGALTQGDLWYAARLVGGVFFRDAPSGTLAVLVGLVVHVVTAGGLASLFALLLPRGGTATAGLMLGLLMGLTLQVLMPGLVVPFASPPLDRAAPHAAFLLVHLAFGASLGTVMPVRKRLATLDRLRHTLRGARQALA